MAENANSGAQPDEMEHDPDVTGLVRALRERRALVDAGKEERQQSEDAALERFAATAVAIEAAWTDGARRVEELELEAERVRDEVRARAAELEAEQRLAVAELARVRPAEDVAALLGLPVDDVLAITAELVEPTEDPGIPEQQTTEQ